MTNRPCSDPQPPNLGGSGLKGKKIVLGITGSIAAYKACLIIRGLIKAGAEVQVVITPAGKEFITPITLSALTHKPVISEFFSQRDGTWNSHVDLGLWADAMLIAPCTASTLGKMANGIADNMLITTYLSMKAPVFIAPAMEAPVFIAPAMDLDMYQHPTTQQNMERLKSFGNQIIEPATGFLASGLEGKGRMEEPENIVTFLDNYFEKKDLEGKRILITAGPTYEKIDPVRFIGNYSSGKMGFALAEECARRGAEVTLVAGPVSLSCSTIVSMWSRARRCIRQRQQPSRPVMRLSFVLLLLTSDLNNRLHRKSRGASPHPPPQGRGALSSSSLLILTLLRLWDR